MYASQITEEIKAAVAQCIRRACVDVRSGEWYAVSLYPDGTISHRCGSGPYSMSEDEYNQRPNAEETIFVQTAITDLDPCGDYAEGTTTEEMIDDLVEMGLTHWINQCECEEQQATAQLG